MAKEPTTIEEFEKAIFKLEKSEKRFGTDQHRAAKIRKFKEQLAKLKKNGK